MKRVVLLVLSAMTGAFLVAWNRIHGRHLDPRFESLVRPIHDVSEERP